MPKVKYVGPFDSVTLAATGADVQQNHQIEVDDETFASLVAQTDWVAVESKKKASPNTSGEPGEPTDGDNP